MKYFRKLIPLFIVLTFMLTGCQDQMPSLFDTEQGPGLAGAGAGIEKAISVREEHGKSLLGLADVVGTAVGLTQDGQAAVLVLTRAAGVRGIPSSLDGVPVVVIVTGEIVALPKPPGKGGGGIDPTSKFDRPVPIGVSTGNEGECSAGTIGARVKNGSSVYALSNNHVYALENNASAGSNVLQPGLYDTGCSFNPNNVIGSLYDYEPIKFDGTANLIDAAIAVSSTDNLGNATPSNGYGTPKTAIVSAQLNQSVQKYGRTTSLTKGIVVGINAEVKVGYRSGTALFTDQIIVQSARGALIKAGDSGSLLVADAEVNPVGLLFAGDRSGKYGIANRIDLVLARFSVTVDGK